MGNLDKDNKTVDLEKKATLLLVGREGEVVWNNGAVNRRDKGILLPLLKKILSKEKFAMIEEHVNLNSWHRYRDQPPNRQGHSNDLPSFWAITNYVEPWGFLKKDPKGYRIFLDRLKTWEGGDEAQIVFYNAWKHLLEVDPNKHDVRAGKEFCNGEGETEIEKGTEQRDAHSEEEGKNGVILILLSDF